MSSPLKDHGSSPARFALSPWQTKCLGVLGLVLVGVPHVFVATGYWDLTVMLHEQSFYVMLGLYAVVAGIIAWVWHAEPWLAAHIRRNWRGIAFIFLATMALFGVVGWGYRVLSDETNLLSVSRSMLRDKTILNNIMSYYYLDIFHHVRSVTDKRPFAFPFAIYLAHVVTGYRYQNLFIVNYLFTAATLSLLYLIVRWRATTRQAVAAVLLCLAQPIFLVCGTSGGFESMALFCQLCVYVALVAYVRQPSIALFFALWASWLMFVNSRYESIAVVAILGLGLLLFHAPFRKHLRQCLWFLPWAAMSMAPLFWLFRLKGDDQETKNGMAAFDLNYLSDHGRDLLVALLKPDFYFLFAPLITLALLGLAVFGAWRYRDRLRLADKGRWRTLMPWLLVVISVVVQTVIYLLYHVGNAQYPYAVRYFLPLAVLGTFGGTLLAIRLRLSATAMLVFGLTAFVLYMPVVIENRLMGTLELPRETKRIYRFLADKPKRETLVIADRPGQYVVLDIGAVNFKYANKEADDITRQMREKVFSQVYAFQEIEVGSGMVSANTSLDPRYSLTPLYEIRSSSRHITRISKVEVAPISARLQMP